MERMRRVVLAAVAALPLGACSLLVDSDVGVRDSAADGGSGDGSPGDAGGDADAGPCGSIGRLQDSFPGGPVSSHWVPRTQGTAASDPTIGNDHLLLGFSGGPEGPSEFTEVESNFAYDLRGHAVTVRAYAADSLCQSTLELREARRFGTYREVIRLGRFGSDFAAFDDDGMLESVPFSGAAHRFWRIREAAGTLELEYADDSGPFLPFATVPSPGFDLDSVLVGLRLDVGDPAQTCNNGIEFDDLNTDDVADPACPFADFRDDFSDAELGRFWFDSPGSCVFATGDGLTISPGAGSTCLVRSTHAYSIAGSELILELAAIPADADARIEVRLAHDDDDYLELRQQAGVLRIDLVEGGVSGGSESYPNAVSAQFWRVRDQSGQLDIATSADGKNFTPRHTASPSGLDLAELRVSFSLAVDAPVTATLGSVNPAP